MEPISWGNITPDSTRAIATWPDPPEVIGVARLGRWDFPEGFFVAAGRLWVWIDTGPPVDFSSGSYAYGHSRPRPKGGEWVRVAGTLFVLPIYQTWETFDPLREELRREGSSLPVGEWLVISVGSKESGQAADSAPRSLGTIVELSEKLSGTTPR